METYEETSFDLNIVNITSTKTNRQQEIIQRTSL